LLPVGAVGDRPFSRNRFADASDREAPVERCGGPGDYAQPRRRNPCASTTFTPVAQGGANFNPLTSFNYRPVGVIVRVTPRVTFDGDIILDLLVESSTLGQDINIAGQNLPSFGSRKIETRLRLRDGESNLLAGLLRDEERRALRRVPGLIRVPG